MRERWKSLKAAKPSSYPDAEPEPTAVKPSQDMHMIFGGLQKVSLVDFPGKIAAVLFTRGCNFLCPYCHNPELVNPNLFAQPIEDEDIFRFLETRITKLQGVVVTGGEPTIHSDLPDLLGRIKKLGFLIKLDTNGSNPSMLDTLLRRDLMDYCAMDVKAPISSYSRITRVSIDPKNILSSLSLIRSSGIAHEFRTTYIDSLLSSEEMHAIGEMVKGCSQFIIQRFKPTKTLDTEFSRYPETSEDKLLEMHAILTSAGISCAIR
jgi:pyruvate formate lyase activating enzyme